MGRDRWRAACPACGGENRSTLSIGVGDTGAVLLRCWKSQCPAESIAAAVGLSVFDLFPERPAPGGGASPPRRRRMLTAGQALQLLDAEAGIVAVAAENLAFGLSLSDADRARLRTSAARVAYLRRESAA